MTRCKLCGKIVDGVEGKDFQPRDGTDLCWCHECDVCGKKLADEYDENVCTECNDRKRKNNYGEEN